MSVTVTKKVTTSLVRSRRSGPPSRVEIEALAHEAGLHPDVVERLVRLGAAQPGEPGAAAHLAQIVRLRRDLGLNYAGAILACELLARIDRLEARRWTRTG
jgi:hypothetical protein